MMRDWAGGYEKLLTILFGYGLVVRQEGRLYVIVSQATGATRRSDHITSWQSEVFEILVNAKCTAMGFLLLCDSKPFMRSRLSKIQSHSSKAAFLP